MADRTPGLYAKFVTSKGDILCQLFEKEAPATVENFVALAKGEREWQDDVSGKRGKDTPLYSGTIFHRVIPDFMIQGGDPSGTGRGGPGYRFYDEFKDSPHTFEQPGKLAMANAGPNTNGSQFFITVAPTPWLLNRHTIFGEVIEGMDIVTAISQVKTGLQDRPAQDVVLKEVVIERV